MTRDEYVEIIVERLYQTIIPTSSLQLVVRGIVEATVDIMLELMMKTHYSEYITREGYPKEGCPAYYFYLRDGRVLVSLTLNYESALEELGIGKEDVSVCRDFPLPIPNIKYNKSKRRWEYTT